jgi:hypothetical protein
MSSQKSALTAPPTLETGQLWEMADSNVLIGLIGKRLVHYKHFRSNSPRAALSLTGKEALQEFLRKNKAVLSKRKPAPAKPAGRQRSARVSA